MDNDELYNYNKPITRELIEEVLNDISKSKINKERDFKLYVYFNSQKQADRWMEMFDNAVREEINKLKNE